MNKRTYAEDEALSWKHVILSMHLVAIPRCLQLCHTPTAGSGSIKPDPRGRMTEWSVAGDGIHRGHVHADPVNWGLSIVVALIGLAAIVDAFYPWLRRGR